MAVIPAASPKHLLTAYCEAFLTQGGQHGQVRSQNPGREIGNPAYVWQHMWTFPLMDLALTLLPLNNCMSLQVPLSQS